MKLVTVEALPQPIGAPPEPALWSAHEHNQMHPELARPLPSPEVNEDHHARVEVNHGRWVVRCPFCPSAQVASASDRRFWCPECGMAEAGGRFVPVVWPEAAEAVEDALLRRPAANRNWRPNESVERLEKDNARRLGRR